MVSAVIWHDVNPVYNPLIQSANVHWVLFPYISCYGGTRKQIRWLAICISALSSIVNCPFENSPHSKPLSTEHSLKHWIVQFLRGQTSSFLHCTILVSFPMLFPPPTEQRYKINVLVSVNITLLHLPLDLATAESDLLTCKIFDLGSSFMGRAFVYFTNPSISWKKKIAKMKANRIMDSSVLRMNEGITGRVGEESGEEGMQKICSCIPAS